MPLQAFAARCLQDCSFSHAQSLLLGTIHTPKALILQSKLSSRVYTLSV